MENGISKLSVDGSLDVEENHGTVTTTTLRDVFTIDKDPYRCVKIDMNKVDSVDEAELELLLDTYIPEWRSAGIRGVWIILPIQHSPAIQIFYKRGFTYHHASNNSLTMTLWLTEGEVNSLPEYANHSLGVAGVVVNSNHEVLVIQELYSTLKPRPWKLPGGLGEKGEEFGQVAVRETLEETGVTCEFVTLLCFRHLLRFRWGCSDIYAACLLRPVDSDAQIQFNKKEIYAAKWIPIKEYVSDPETSRLNRYIIECYQNYQETGRALHAHQIKRVSSNKSNTVYSATGPPNNTTNLQ